MYSKISSPKMCFFDFYSSFSVIMAGVVRLVVCSFSGSCFFGVFVF